MTKALESPTFSASLAGNVDASISDDRSGAKAIEIVEAAAAAADTEYSVQVPLHTRRFTARLQGAVSAPGKLSYAYQTGGPYDTKPAGGTLGPEYLSPDAPQLTLYFKTTVAPDVLTVVAYL